MIGLILKHAAMMVEIVVYRMLETIFALTVTVFKKTRLHIIIVLSSIRSGMEYVMILPIIECVDMTMVYIRRKKTNTLLV